MVGDPCLLVFHQKAGGENNKVDKLSVRHKTHNEVQG